MGPLGGVTVLDLTRVLSGPYCTMMLADLGARVIKIEHPARGDDTRAWGPPFLGDESAYFLSINRNKEGITLDFKHPEGRPLLDRLLARADVFVENFKPGTLAKIDLDYESLKETYPRLVYCSISGFGQTGPRRGEPGYDAVAQAEGGLMSITGTPDGPPVRLGVAISDIVSGMFAAQGITSALLARERTGSGQEVDIAMLDSVAALLTYQAGIYFATSVPPPRIGNRHPTIVPYETFAASDGDFVLAIGNDELWQRFCVVADLEQEERFATNRQRVTEYAALKTLLDARLRTHTRAYWLERLKAAGIPCGSVRDLHALFTDPQIASRDMIVEVDHANVGIMRVLGTPLKMSGGSPGVRTAPPTLGQHTDAVLTADLGLSSEQVRDFRRRGIV